MATLTQIGLQGFVGYAPNPVASYVIRESLSEDKLLNLMQFINIGERSGFGNFVGAYIDSDEIADAEFRGLGEKYKENTAKYKSNLVNLKILGGSFKSDIEIHRAFALNNSVAGNWTKEQVLSKLEAIKKSYSQYFILGNSTLHNKQFDGLEVKLDPKQIYPETIDVAKLNSAKAFEVELKLNKVIAMLKCKPNLIITTKNGKDILGTLNSYRHKNINALNIGDLAYEQYMGIPIVDLPDKCFKAGEAGDGVANALYFVYINEVDGVCTAVPSDGDFVRILEPSFNGGKVTSSGTCEVVCAPVFRGKKSIAKCLLANIQSKSAEEILTDGGQKSALQRRLAGEAVVPEDIADITPEENTICEKELQPELGNLRVKMNPVVV